MTEQQHSTKKQPESPSRTDLDATADFTRRWQDFTAYIGQHEYDREQAATLLQLAVELADQGPSRASLRLEWRNIHAAVATLTRTDSETLHARLTIGFSPAEFKWMLQNKALYTWHSQPVRFQRCLQCMVAKLGQCGSSAEKTCWSCRSRLTDALPGKAASQGNSLRPPRHVALTMAKTAAKQPIGAHEVDAHISIYEQSKWPLTKRDQTYLSQANKFWTFISSPNYLGITDQNQLLDLTHRACTKRYILYMHKMNKRENVRAAVDLACLGLKSADPSHSGSQPQSAQSAPELPSSAIGAAEAKVEPSLDMPSTSLASVAQAPSLAAAATGQAGTAVAATAAAETEEEALSPLQLYDNQTDPLRRRSARVLMSQPQTSEPSSSAQGTAAWPSTGTKHDWVSPSKELLATLQQELDLELRDAPDDSDGSRGRESSLAKKCRPWHWLQEMRQYGYERQVMPKDQKKRRKRTLSQGAAAPSNSAPGSTEAATQVSQPARRQQLRRKAARQISLDTDSSDSESPVEAEDDEEGESPPPEVSRRQRTHRGNRASSKRPAAEAAAVPKPSQARQGSSSEVLQQLQLEGWGQAESGGPKASQSLKQQAQEDLLLGLGPLASFGAGGGTLGASQGGSHSTQPITGVLTFPQTEQSSRPHSTQLNISSLAWSVPGLESSIGQSQQPLAQLPQRGQSRASNRSNLEMDVDLPPLLDSSLLSMSSDARLQQRYAAPVQCSDNLLSSTFPSYSQPRQSWGPSFSERVQQQQQQQIRQHQQQLQQQQQQALANANANLHAVAGQAGHAQPQHAQHGLQQSALQHVLRGAPFGLPEEQLASQGSQFQGFDNTRQHASGFCQGYASQHGLGGFPQPAPVHSQQSSLDLFSRYAQQQQQQPSLPTRSGANQWAIALQQHQQQQQSQHAAQRPAQGSLFGPNPNLPQGGRPRDVPGSQSNMFSFEPSLSIAQQYGSQQTSSMPSDDLDSAHRQAMQGHADPWEPVLQLPTATDNPPPSAMDSFAGTQIPRPSYHSVSCGSIQPPAQLPFDFMQQSGAGQSKHGQQRSSDSQAQQDPSSRQPTSD